MEQLTDAHVSECLTRFFPMVDTFELKGLSAVSIKPLLELLDHWPRLQSLTLDHHTRIVTPLSAILSQRFNAPLRSINLQGYALCRLFSEKFLDNIL